MANYDNNLYGAANTVEKARAIYEGVQDPELTLFDFDFEVLEDRLKAMGHEDVAAKVFTAFGMKLQLELKGPWIDAAAVLILMALGSITVEQIAA